MPPSADARAARQCNIKNAAPAWPCAAGSAFWPQPGERCGRNPLASMSAKGQKQMRSGLGFSLAEFMLLLLINLVIGAMGLSLYQVKNLCYLKQDALKEQKQNLKAALSSLAREARMAGNIHKLAGWGVKKIQLYLPDGQGGGRWFRYPGASEAGLRPVYGLDGGPDAPDELTLLSAALESAQPIGRLAGPYSPGQAADQSLIFKRPLPDNAISPGQMLLLCDGRSALIIQAGRLGGERSIDIGESFRPATALPGPPASFPAGTRVYNLGEVFLTSYYIDRARNILMAREYYGGPKRAGYGRGDTVFVAYGIEDLQLQYILADGPPLSAGEGMNQPQEAALDEYPIKVINLVLVSKSTYRGKSLASGDIAPIFNRRARAGDEYKRQILSESIFLR